MIAADLASRRQRAEDLWERIGGELCVCQRVDVPHWCESCQQKISLILDALDRSLSPSQEPEKQLIALAKETAAKIQRIDASYSGAIDDVEELLWRTFRSLTEPLKADVARLTSDLAHQQELVKQVAEERDGLKLENVHQMKRAEAAEADLLRLQSALKTHGQHKETCNAHGDPFVVQSREDSRCTCGYAAFCDGSE